MWQPYRIGQRIFQTGAALTLDARTPWRAIMLVGRAKSGRYTDGHAWGSAHTEARIVFDVSIVEPNSNSYSKRSGSNQSFFNANAGTRDAKRTKVKKYKELCTQRPRTSVCPNHLHDQRGHGRGIPATNSESTLEEGRG